MDEIPSTGGRPAVEDAGRATRHTVAWLLLVAALALHVMDEALTDFLGFYNPLVRDLRARWGWLPMPTFSFGVWLAGLVLGVIVLAILGLAVWRGVRGTWFASWALSVIMLVNGLGHLAGSVYFERWLPGATSAPLLVAASLVLMWRTVQRMERAGAGAGSGVPT